MSSVDADLGELGAEGVARRVGRLADVLGGRGFGAERAVAAGTAGSGAARLDALLTAHAHEAVPIEPPATIAGGSALSPISTRTCSDRHAERVGGDLRERRARAGADVGGVDPDDEAAVRPGRARPVAATAARRAG